jgi:transposase
LVYDGLVNAGYKHHYRVKHSDDVFAIGRAHVNGMENFWGVAKSRLARFRGLQKHTFHLHLKECEFRFRFNHQQTDIYPLVLKMCGENPLS